MIESHLRQYCLWILDHILPEDDILGSIFNASFSVGLHLGLSIVNPVVSTINPLVIHDYEHSPAGEDIRQIGAFSKQFETIAMYEQHQQEPQRLVEEVSALPPAQQPVNPIARMISNEQAPVDMVQLRRSTRSMRYDGFCVPQPSDVKSATSKVKARVTPSITNATKTTAPQPMLQAKATSPQDDAVPPPTPIITIQSIGINLCGIDKDELSPKKLLASLQGANLADPHS